MDIAQAGEHVKDAASFHLPFGFHVELPLINLGSYSVPAYSVDVGGYSVHLGGFTVALEFQVTKFMVLEVAVAMLMVLVFVPLAWKLRGGRRPQGRFVNLFEAMLMFLRDQVARPAIGHHDADRYLPFVWTVFFFVLFCNLMGVVPWTGSPTGALAVTAALALITFLTVIVSGMARFGVVGYWVGMVPEMQLPLVLAVFLKPMLMFIEIVGLLIKHAVLAVRLLANMFAGHLVLAVIVGFIAATANTWLLWSGVTLFSVAACVALDMLELLVAFLQAYIFAFLSALFIGMAVHKH